MGMVDVSEFLNVKQEELPIETEPEVEELDVQKAVVEELAADKAKIEVEVEDLRTKLASLTAELTAAKSEIDRLGAALAVNVEGNLSNQVTLLERDVNLPDNFEGETRDHVLEVIKEARDRAESEGRLRRAQVLESVLVANEPTGNLEKNRTSLQKMFAENQNILSGPVLEELKKLGIPHKNGEEYLLPGEIIKRTY